MQNLVKKLAVTPQFATQPQVATQPVQASFQVSKDQALNIIRDFKKHLPQGITPDPQGKIQGLSLSAPKTMAQTSLITFSGPNAQILAQAFSVFYQNYLQKLAMPTTPQHAPQPVPTSFQVPQQQAIDIIRDFKKHLPQGITADQKGKIQGLNLSTPNTMGGQISIITFSGPNAQILAQAFSNFYQNYLQRHQVPSKKF